MFTIVYIKKMSIWPILFTNESTNKLLNSGSPRVTSGKPRVPNGQGGPKARTAANEDVHPWGWEGRHLLAEAPQKQRVGQAFPRQEEAARLHAGTPRLGPEGGEHPAAYSTLGSPRPLRPPLHFQAPGVFIAPWPRHPHAWLQQRDWLFVRADRYLFQPVLSPSCRVVPHISPYKWGRNRNLHGVPPRFTTSWDKTVPSRGRQLELNPSKQTPSWGLKRL